MFKIDVGTWSDSEGFSGVQLETDHYIIQLTRPRATKLVRELCEVLYPWDTDKHVAASLRHHLRRARLATFELSKRGYSVETPDYIDDWNIRDEILITRKVSL